MTDVPPQYTLPTPDTRPPITSGYWVVEGQFLAGAYPASPVRTAHWVKVRELLNAGILTIINLTESTERGHDSHPFVPYEHEVRKLSNGWLEKPECLRFGIRDLGVPTIECMTKILDAIDNSLDAGRPVYVHCYGGVGRTGVVVGCWLLRHGLATQDTVLGILAGLRQQDRESGHRPAPENGTQRRFVRNWLTGA